MRNSIFTFVKKQLDAFIYGLIGPFAVLYVFPMFFIDIETRLGVPKLGLNKIEIIGVVLMNLGGVLAIYCALLMYLSKKSSPSPFSLTTKVIQSGPYSVVRHPMMWSLHLVILGEIIVKDSPMLILWFLIWLRFSFMYIAKYEEPYLVSILGKEYIDYCKKTPRWIPSLDIFKIF